MIAARSGGRLRYVHESGQWLFFTDRDGWRPVKTATVEEHLADCARANVGSVDKNGDCRMRPGSSGSKTFAHNVARLLHGRSEIVTHEADWDSERNIVCLPSGALLDVLTGERRRPTVGALHARRVRVEPASAADFAASRFCQVLQHAIPSHAERNYLQRRLGAALADAEGLDDLIWLYGSPGCGKSTLLEGVKQTLGDYAGGVPINELLRGVNKGHSAWLARLAGCRLLYTDDVPVGHYLDDGTINRLLGSGITAQQYETGAV